MDLPYLINQTKLRGARVHIEIGMGRGAFLAQFAQEHANDLCIGIERARPFFLEAHARIAPLNLPHVHLLNAPAEPLLYRTLTFPCVDTYYILFPDPWPKKDQKRRRMFTQRNVSRLWHTLVLGGRIVFGSDHADYVYAVDTLFSRHFSDAFSRQDLQGLPFATHYQLKYARQGRPMFYRAWTKKAIAPGLLRSDDTLPYAARLSAPWGKPTHRAL